MRFKKSSYLCNTKIQGGAARANVEAAASFPHLSKITIEDGCDNEQIVSVDETTFYWKKMPSRSFIAREKSVLGFKVSRHRLSF